MNKQQPERRRFQFGVRKLLLWTAAAALVFGMGEALGGDAWVLASWTVAVGVVRVAFGPKIAAVLSVAGGVILAAGFAYFVTSVASPRPVASEPMAHGVLAGTLFGLVAFSVAEGLYCAVNWADNLARTKTDE